MRITKMIVCMLLALSIVCGQYIPANAQERNDLKYEQTAQATIVVEENADYEVLLVITGVDEESGDAYGYFSVSSYDMLGVVNADGVRLRSEASLKSKVLELMYYDELVTIHNSVRNDEGKWFYITRDDTGTNGYVFSTYIEQIPGC